jgi:hypothetical protein
LSPKPAKAPAYARAEQGRPAAARRIHDDRGGLVFWDRLVEPITESLVEQGIDESWIQVGHHAMLSGAYGLGRWWDLTVLKDGVPLGAITLTSHTASINSVSARRLSSTNPNIGGGLAFQERYGKVFRQVRADGLSLWPARAIACRGHQRDGHAPGDSQQLLDLRRAVHRDRGARSHAPSRA